MEEAEKRSGRSSTAEFWGHGRMVHTALENMNLHSQIHIHLPCYLAPLSDVESRSKRHLS